MNCRCHPIATTAHGLAGWGRTVYGLTPCDTCLLFFVCERVAPPGQGRRRVEPIHVPSRAVHELLRNALGWLPVPPRRLGCNSRNRISLYFGVYLGTCR